MLVSVLINNYNYGRYLGEAIDSALGQTYPHVEVVVVDDGSTDDSREVITGYEDRVVAVFKPNGGQASAFNAGFAASSGDVVCFLDADDSFTAEKATEVVTAFAEHPDVGSCFHPVQWVSEDDTPLAGQSGLRGVSRRFDFRAEMRSGCSSFPAPATSGLCFRRSLLARIFPMPEAPGVSISDFYLKITSLGLAPMYYLDKELTLQKVHGGNRYTFREDYHVLRARIHLLTAYWVHRNVPELSACADRLFARSLGYYRGAGGIESAYSQFARAYWSHMPVPSRLEAAVRATYHWLRARTASARRRPG